VGLELDQVALGIAQAGPAPAGGGPRRRGRAAVDRNSGNGPIPRCF